MLGDEANRFSAFFQKPDQPSRGKFHSRLFGIFNEELVRFWAADERAPYRDIGRPTIFNAGDLKGRTLDFTFEDRATGKRFVVEMKCEIELRGYRFMTLREPRQLFHHNKPAFDLFRSLARDPQSCWVHVHRQRIDVAGAILVWGNVTEVGRSATIAAYGFKDIVGMNRILEDLWLWQPEPFVAFVQSLSDWSNELFEFLNGKERLMIASFKRDDEGYIYWRDVHSDGFICNIPYAKGEHSWKSICVHKASCHQLATDKNGEKPWTTNGYFKLCADNLDRIEDWIKNRVDVPSGWQIRRCGKCAP